MLILPLLLLAVAAWCDLKSRTIPDWIAAALLGWAIVATACGAVGSSWSGLAGGLLLAGGLAVPLFWLGGLGGGDVKLIVALGAVLGPTALVGVLFWMAIAGGVLALVAKWGGRRDLAYAPAIASGLLIHTIRAGGFDHVL